jgi:hypothetical protein
MAVVTKVRRLVANPHRSRKRKKSNPSGHRRRMTAKQIKFFGTSRQRAALKRKRSASKPVVTSSHRKVRARPRKAPARRKRQLNPALLITLGAVNPRRKAVATKRRKKAHTAANPHRRRRRNTRVVVAAPRRRINSRRRRRHNPRRRSNPAFGLRGAGMAKAVVGGLAGMAAAKFLPTLVPSGLITGNLMRTVATAASAFVAQMVAKAVVKDPSISDAVLFGGLMQTGSVALNAFLPSIASSLGLSGMGQIMDADWSIPENPLKLHAAPPAPAPALAGLAFAYGRG